MAPDARRELVRAEHLATLLQQEPQQRDRIGASRNGDADVVAGPDHFVSWREAAGVNRPEDSLL